MSDKNINQLSISEWVSPASAFANFVFFVAYTNAPGSFSRTLLFWWGCFRLGNPQPEKPVEYANPNHLGFRCKASISFVCCPTAAHLGFYSISSPTAWPVSIPRGWLRKNYLLYYSGYSTSFPPTIGTTGNWDHWLILSSNSHAVFLFICRRFWRGSSRYGSKLLVKREYL